MATVQEPKWLSTVQIRMLHADSLRIFGGRSGLRDYHLLESALARPKQLFVYGENPDICALAAEYGFGLARNHAFVDGNKRVALLAVRAFLFINGYRFDPDQVDTVTTFEQVAAGIIDQQQLTNWLRRHTTKRA